MSSDAELLREFLDFLTEGIISFARAQVNAGARACFLIDPFASIDILGADFFRTFSLPYINRIARALRSSQAADNVLGSDCLDAALIFHICGEPAVVAAASEGVDCACLSLHGLDGAAQGALQGRLLAGGLDISFSSGVAVMGSGGAQQAEPDPRRSGFQIIAPSCSLDANVSFAALRTARDALLKPS
jgi:[methyl-Co(III) methanol-specific corrinoid protein]:coenzyme M methyltransferase